MGSVFTLNSCKVRSCVVAIQTLLLLTETEVLKRFSLVCSVIIYNRCDKISISFEKCILIYSITVPQICPARFCRSI